MSDTPLVTIVVLNWHGAHDTVMCLHSLVHLRHKRWRVVVVDNASTDDSVEVIERAILSLPRCDDEPHYEWRDLKAATMGLVDASLTARYTLIRAPSNGGFASGNNIGLGAALATSDCAYAWLLNNDTEVDPDALGALLRRAQASPNCMVGSVLIYHDTRRVVQCVGGVYFSKWRALGWQVGQGEAWPPAKPLAEPTSLSYAAGASMLVATAAMRASGLMHEGFFLYYEEIDWAMRLRVHGPVAVAVDSVVFHKEGGSIGTSSRHKRSAMSQYYLARNLVLFYRRQWPWCLPLPLARNVRECLRQFVQGHYDLAWATLRATAHGLCGRSGKEPT